jgi:patatin-related protein
VWQTETNQHSRAIYTKGLSFRTGFTVNGGLMTASPNTEYTQEVRFAVVMYGGVSLAIYINGIAQELLRMVRSTSRPVDKLENTEKVYRRLSCLLSDQELLRKFRDVVDKPTPPARPDIVDDRVAENNVNTRFVVDILSGTSAGGINAVYLAKALANDQDLEELKKLWVTEGDIGLLINDKQSVAGLHLTNQQPPQSLLNSRRMYFKLLKALKGMEKQRKSSDDFSSPYIDELDLFITATDLEGTIFPMRLSDTVVYERRHRKSFHFKYAKPEATGLQRNDFLGDNDPFLAFAARCTSSFPFAFEPMRLCDVDEVLNRFPEYDDKQKRQDLIDGWKKFFKENTNPLTGQPIELGTRSYGDGGILDNKPFSFATETLLRRDAPVVVDRKLIYIEPSPEHPEDEPPRVGRYQALENVKAALLDLPGYETIREDLTRVMDRNELIKRVNRITDATERDLDNVTLQRKALEPGEWDRLDLPGMVGKFGRYYIPYHRLRISSTTDELAKLVSRSLNLNLQSAQFTAVRLLIHAWREQTFPDYHRRPQDGKLPKRDEKKDPPYIANKFLKNYDFKYWVRRLTFIRGKIDQLSGLIRLPARDDGTGVDENKISHADKALLERLRHLEYCPLDYSTISPERKQKIQDVLSYFRCEVRELYKGLRTGGRTIQSPPNKNSTAAHKTFAKTIADINLSSDDIDSLLGLPKRDPKAGTTDGVVTQQEFSRIDEYEIGKRAKRLLFKPPFFKTSPLVSADGMWVLKTPTLEPELLRTELGKRFDAMGKALAVLFQEQVGEKVFVRGKALFRPDKELPTPVERCQSFKFQGETDTDIKAVRDYLWHYFSQFDDFDQIRFPILFGTEVGESDVVDILRISPEDATSLIDERAERQKTNGRQKLAGTTLHHFGAFLDQVWRQNDILWGRLDGAERLITALLPEPENKNVRAQLIGEAHDAILVDELQQKSDAALQLVITETLVKVSSGMTAKAALAKIFPRLRDEQLRARLGTAIDAGLRNDKLLAFIKSSYEVNRDLDPKIVLRSIARSTQVIGKMFEDMANQHELEGKRLAWIARLGQFFWGLVEVAVPGSLLNLLFLHWLKIIYAFEIFLIVASILLGEKDVTKFGWIAFALTAALNVIVLLLGDYIRGRGIVRRSLFVLFVIAFLFFATIGVDDVFGLGWKAKLFSIVTGIFQ